MPLKMRAAKEFRLCASSTLASALSKLSSSSPGRNEEPLVEAAESGRTIIDTGSDGCGSTGGGGGEILSAAGFGKITDLPATAGFANPVDFGGIGLAGDFEPVSMFAGGCWTGVVVSGAGSSVGGAVSTAADGAISVVPSSRLAVGSEVDFSEVINDSIDRSGVERSGSAFMWERLSAATGDVNRIPREE